MATRASRKPAPRRNQAGPRARWLTQEGRRLLVIENARFRVAMWPELGGAITSYIHKPTGLDVIWRKAPAQKPRRSVLGQPWSEGSDLFDVMDGSWYVSLPNGFFRTDYFGAPLGTHGELRSVPWSVESIRRTASTLRVVLVGMSVRTPLVYRRELTVRAGSAQLHWKETLGNRSSAPLPVAWLHHPAFSGPLLVGARLVAPVRTVSVNPTNHPASLQLKAGYRGRWPHVPERKGKKRRDCSAAPVAGSGTDHSVQLQDFSSGRGCLWNERLKLGFAIQWDLAMFPCAWSWAHAGGGVPRYPMWGEGHLMTLQPSTSPPRPFKELLRRGELRLVPARGSVSTEMRTGFVDHPEGPWAD